MEYCKIGFLKQFFFVFCFFTWVAWRPSFAESESNGSIYDYLTFEVEQVAKVNSSQLQSILENHGGLGAACLAVSALVDRLVVQGREATHFLVMYGRENVRSDADYSSGYWVSFDVNLDDNKVNVSVGLTPRNELACSVNFNVVTALPEKCGSSIKKLTLSNPLSDNGMLFYEPKLNLFYRFVDQNSICVISVWRSSHALD